jgi:hypothetical protein
MRLEVTDILHREGHTILHCKYDDDYDDVRLVDTCVKLGMPKELAEEKPRAVREMRIERARAKYAIRIHNAKLLGL